MSNIPLVATDNLTRMFEQWGPQLAELPEEDWPLVVDFVEYLKRQRNTRQRKALAAQIRAEARERAKELESVPREQAAVRFAQLIEQIRQTAIVQDTAIEGDWECD